MTASRLVLVVASEFANNRPEQNKGAEIPYYFWLTKVAHHPHDEPGVKVLHPPGRIYMEPPTRQDTGGWILLISVSHSLLGVSLTYP